MSTVPLHTYKRPGGGGTDCSDRLVITNLIFGRLPLPDGVAALTPGLTDGGVVLTPVDPPWGTPMSATMMLATAAIAAASSTCHRSSRRQPLLLDRATDHILASLLHSIQGATSCKDATVTSSSALCSRPVFSICRACRAVNRPAAPSWARIATGPGRRSRGARRSSSVRLAIYDCEMRVRFGMSNCPAP